MSSIVLKGSTSGDVTVQAPAVATGTVTMPSASGTLLTTTGDGSSLTGVGKFSSYAIIADQKSAGTHGGTFTTGAWRTRDLNTEIADPDGIVSISSNQFTLGAGSYLIKWSAVGFRVNLHKSALYDVTGTAYIEYGDTRWGDSNASNDWNGEPDPSTGMARVTHSGSNVYEIRHYAETTYSTSGFGLAGGAYVDSTVEKYCFVEIYKES